ncbi:MAG TPA: sigma 54-interacting transcriptional regulator, partial [Candidatus Binataceae bacterium]|nr:sigma 54-interacting transcriptional regulator [Candidatus Binataceae bacterium]
AGELSMPAQAKLLRVLTDGLVTRVGSIRPRRVDVRLVVATHRDLKRRVQDGLFRDDLYYRLAVVPLEVPPLRERREDIPALCDLFLMHAARDLKVPLRTISAEAMRTLMNYDFPGNIRELRNLIERACILSAADEIIAENFPVAAQIRGAAVAAGRPSPTAPQRPITPDEVAEMMPETLELREFLSSLESALIQRALRTTGGAQAEASRRLGLSRSDISYKLGKHNIRRTAAD